ncbi:MAG: UDP-glucose/GDP-mannose dehydrogenase family protein [Anaerolineales bacterium]|jgi:UDPglucose 6-dehydrogenase|nr:UDP-glucose/GDP-mannose dehydrogenase family protein [Anaerolineales bacterium]MCC6986367.1 UDP-glucose/GDP-mannose dehydrogenase family protein [Anaerolineales bacterium]
MKQICVVGVGYVGLVTAACFADLGNRVAALDVNEERVTNLKKGIMPIYEPGLDELVKRNVKAGRITFTTSYADALKGAEYAFIAVGTPSGSDGSADLQYVAAAATSIAKNMTAPLVLINKSTVPIGTGDWVADIVKGAQPKPIDFAVVSCPEFLREGSAIGDFMNPHRTVIGSLDRDAANKVAQLHLPLRAPIVITDLRTAEMIKYASNAFLATKISFINELADLCERVGADVKEVAAGMGYDARIGRHFLDAGLGWGGSCFPKDVEALAFMAKEKGLEPKILNSVMDVNYDRRKEAVKIVENLLGGSLKGRTIGMLGLAFKPNTDDMRDAPSIDISEELIEAGAKVRAYDPVAMDVARPILPAVEMFDEPYKVADGADALMIITEWNEFKQLDLDKVKSLLKSPIIYDGRNIYEPGRMKDMGFTYRAIGR